MELPQKVVTEPHFLSIINHTDKLNSRVNNAGKAIVGKQTNIYRICPILIIHVITRRMNELGLYNNDKTSLLKVMKTCKCSLNVICMVIKI